jgi:hypothetical protein
MNEFQDKENEIDVFLLSTCVAGSRCLDLWVALSLAAGWPAAHFAPDGSTLASAGARAGWAST